MEIIKYEEAKKEHVIMMHNIEEESFITPWSLKSMQEDIVNNDLATYFVAIVNNEVIGYMGIWHIVDQAHITTLAIKKEYRRQHIGENLIKIVFEKLRTLAINEVTLEVRENNFKAINLYKKLGFYEEGKRINYYSDTNEDAIIMWKKL